MEVNTISIRFAGNKADLKRQLEELAKAKGQSQNATIIECVEALLAQRQKETIKP